jgi:hypothetical protein
MRHVAVEVNIPQEGINCAQRAKDTKSKTRGRPPVISRAATFHDDCGSPSIISGHPVTFWMYMNDLMCRNGSKIVSKFEKDHLSRSSHLLYSPGIIPCDFCYFGVLKGILEDREFNMNDEFEETIESAQNDLIFMAPERIYATG